ncbi:OVARIAN TUMOR DOMAIN-containing deubiquitinating enzyme 9-like isoform X2 [Prosopis cineraria]|uniref:OVARIAN TUMOR DOMAIN-containing deubiquitinating enzyme 9-like isoform X2 n=1 Tax=Prosopis cineraria TaxID=364024 RepID=UPI0024100EBE|nr:OVARIAN TUMOR DOMAIN-containing deubiquitinating enzyme 9-like isoform X2 [Prosopis cineraria]XP_054823763.1 OVARIAN TUMOR DOMAIN-containing deubiquitinating enzyme 9-like isoform X2 [Prosopis cineraria]XP_054823764.1 OVARIAN TUMOR DOMAIN-containing deubiquitinating enzyme 9-like isoform X2 [Prosopis cineraria]
MEASGSSNSENQHVRASVLAQDWCSDSNRSHDSVTISCPPYVGSDTYQKAIDEPNNMKEVENYGQSEKENDTVHEIDIFGSSSGSDVPVFNEDLWHSLEISDESVLDGEVGKRLNQMVPIPHIPKINEKLPSDDEQISDHQRLLDRLQLYDLVENKVEGDGNCQFRALSDQLYRSSEHHKFVREQIIKQLKSHPELYSGYVPMAYSDYLRKMDRSGEWGDHVTLQAAADWYGVKIFVITSFKDTCYIEILPQMQRSERVIFLSFWAEVHYNSIYPEGELPISCSKKKKRWWNFGG